MGKIKIGDRVRAIHTSGGGGVQAGDVFVVTKIGDGDIGFFNPRVGRHDGWGSYNFELTFTISPGKHYRTRSGKPTGRVTVGDTGFEAVVDGRVRIFDAAGGAVHGSPELDIVEAWVPKVGERVRRFKGHNSGVGIGHEAVVKELEDISHCDTEGPWLKFEDGTRGYATSFEPLPVAPQPAAMKIEAGRYYKTRDGRKVGPMVRDDWGDGQPWTDGDRWYCEDGQWERSKANGKDLIAEWHEATANVGAQVDTLAEEYGSAAAAASNDNAAKPKFKVGDRVRFRDGYGSSSAGKHATVVKINVWGDDGVQVDQGGYDGISTEEASDLELVTSTTAIVALIENGQPKPADIPHVHTNQAAAEREAKRLAGVHKGKQFGVFVLAGTERVEPVYEHEWQRLAAGGKKIDAIKELRAVTGMQLKPAKDVVEHFLDYPYGQAA